MPQTQASVCVSVTLVVFMNLFSQLKFEIELFPECSSSPLSGFGFPSGGCMTPIPLTTPCKSDSYINPLYIMWALWILK